MSIFLFPYFCEVNSFVIKRIITLNYQEHEKDNLLFGFIKKIYWELYCRLSFLGE